MAGRPLRKARKRITRSLAELVELLALRGMPIVSPDVQDAFAQGIITNDEAIVLTRHAELSQREQARALRDAAPLDTDKLRARINEKAERWRAPRALDEGDTGGA